jgi:hypothetical protein
MRLWGIDFGLPHIYHTDEWFEVKRSLKLGAGIFDFARVEKGGYFYLLYFEYGIYYMLLKVLGVVQSTDDFLLRYFQDPSEIWLIGRVTTAIIGTLNCYVLYVLGKRAHSENAGLVAAALLAIHPIHVAHSHVITVDVPLTTLITLCFLIMFWKFPDPKATKRRYSLLGICAALAVMTKIPGAVILLSALVYHLYNTRFVLSETTPRSQLIDARFVYFVLSFSLCYLIGNPGFLFKSKKIAFWVLSIIVPENILHSSSASTVLKWPLAHIKSPLDHYMNALFPWKYGLMTLAICSGLALSLKKNRGRELIFLSFLLPYFGFLIASKDPDHIFSRYTLPMLPVLFLYAGVALDFVVRAVKDNLPFGKTAILVLVLLPVFIPLLKDSVEFDFSITKPDTRTIAKAWIENNISPDKTIVIEGTLITASSMTVPLQLNPDLINEFFYRYANNYEDSTIKNKFYHIKKLSLRGQKTYHLIFTMNKEQLEEALKEKSFDYVILRENLIQAFALEQSRQSFPEINELIEVLGSGNFQLIKSFTSGSHLKGPSLFIYKKVT